eukprot:6188669-Pleurochrysis_carterae.AAC.1
MTAELLHARFNHRRAEVLRLLPKCTRDAPKSDAVHSTAHVPVAKAAGDFVSYNIYCVSVPQIHDCEQCVINFHDHYSALNMPYLLGRKSDAFKAMQYYVTFCSTDNAQAHAHRQRRRLDFAADSGFPPPKWHTPHNHIATCPQAERRMRAPVAHNAQGYP